MDELIYAAQRGDDAALAVLWERVKQYACAVACRFKPCAFADFDDFRQCAYLGFRAAVRAYTGIGFGPIRATQHEHEDVRRSECRRNNRALMARINSERK